MSSAIAGVAGAIDFRNAPGTSSDEGLQVEFAGCRMVVFNPIQSAR
jgi:hypothetical protein